MDIIPEHIREEIVTAELERYSEMHTDLVRKAINSIPGYLVTTAMVADLSACLSKLSGNLPTAPRELAQGHFDDCYDDMMGFA